jgi:hypothetical protein
MRWSTLRHVVVVVAVAAGGCGFAPGATGSGATGSGASGGPLGTGASTGAGLVGGGGAQNGNGGIPGMNCAAVDQPLNRLPPDILIVLDASGSMNQDVDNNDCGGTCGANSKWALLTPVLRDVVMQTQADVNWGLKMFADTDSTCGVAPNTVAVPIAANNAGAIATQIQNRTDANGQSPWAAARRRGWRKTPPSTTWYGWDLEPEVHPAGDRRPAELRGGPAATRLMTHRARSPR